MRKCLPVYLTPNLHQAMRTLAFIKPHSEQDSMSSLAERAIVDYLLDHAELLKQHGFDVDKIKLKGD